MECQFCSKVCKSKNSKAQHEIRCKSNPEGIKVKPSCGMLGKKGSNQYLKAKKLGLAKPILSDETRKKLSENAKNIEWTEEKRKKHSDSMVKAVQIHPESYIKNNVYGRVKIYTYKGCKLKGTWELKTAEWLDSYGVTWINEQIAHKYIWKDKERLYYPDFYIPEYDFYIEVKGFVTDRDKAKWEQFKDKLIVFDKDIIYNLKTISFDDILKRICTCSSAVQNNELITRQTRVRIPTGAPYQEVC